MKPLLRARLATVDRHIISTRRGAVEYAERGSGAPVLVVHGIFQHCVSGLFSIRDLLLDRRVIAPSRFGYLGSSMAPNATPAAQADAFAALLDALDIGQVDVVGFSAGAPSALQLALRHPEKVKHLAVLVGNLPGSPTASVQLSWTKRVNRRFIMWALRTFAPSTTARLVAAALTLKVVGGLTTDEIARAFLSRETTIAQRIVRAKKAIAEAGLTFEVPRGAERVARLPSVLEVIYLIFNECYAATAGDDLVRPGLCLEAQRLGRILAGRALPHSMIGCASCRPRP
jgi:pimeloyl-ACP methyl ester carboxylesterase